MVSTCRFLLCVSFFSLNSLSGCSLFCVFVLGPRQVRFLSGFADGQEVALQQFSGFLGDCLSLQNTLCSFGTHFVPCSWICVIETCIMVLQYHRDMVSCTCKFSICGICTHGFFMIIYFKKNICVVLQRFTKIVFLNIT